MNRVTREGGCHQVDVSLVQKAVREAAVATGLTERGICHSRRHPFATHLLEGGYDIRMVQELVGDSDGKTPMVCTRVLHRGPASVRSPADALVGGALGGSMYYAAMKAMVERGTVGRASVEWLVTGCSADRCGGGGRSADPGKLCSTSKEGGSR